MIDINCDMGEGVGNEAQLMPYISSANIACGYHAGDEATMKGVIRLCLEYNVKVGAHPSFPDRENFGRANMNLTLEEVYAMIIAQLNSITTVAHECGARLHHIKPHGALYNRAAKDADLARSIAQAVKDFNPALIYYGLSGSLMIDEAKKLGLQTSNEVFADRTYQPDGSLTPRSDPNALLNEVEDVVRQVLKMVREKKVRVISGDEIFIHAETICIHGDGVHAIAFAKAIYSTLHEK